MNFLTILLIVSALGIGAVFWILKSESDGTEEAGDAEKAAKPAPPVTPVPEDEKPASKSLFAQLMAKRKKSAAEKSPGAAKLNFSGKSLSGILDKFKKGKPSDNNDEASTAMPGLKEMLEKGGGQEQNSDEPKIQEPQQPQPPSGPSGTAGITTTPAELPDSNDTLTEDEEKTIEREIEISTELTELKEKYSKLEELYKEKSSEYEKTKESLNNELEHRKEFNKVKDLLEKELKDSKDKTRTVEVELNNTQTENENEKKRNEQLEEKTGKLEKELLQKDDKIDELVKRMQTFASPSTADQPPAAEAPKDDEKSDVPEASGPAETAPPAPTPESNADESKLAESPVEPPAPSDPEPAPETSSEPEPAPETPAETTAEPAQETPPSQEKEKKPAESGQEGGEKAEEKTESQEEPAQKGGFKLDLDIEVPKPPVEENNDEFLKLKPDVLEGETSGDGKPADDASGDAEGENKQTP